MRDSFLPSRSGVSGRAPLAARLGMVLGLVCLLGAGASNRGANHRSVGGKLPRLELQALTGTSENTVLADLEGRVALIHFWGAWCPPCVKEFPHIAALERKYRGNEGVRVLAVASMPDVNPDLDELRSDTEKFLVKNESDLPNYADVKDRTRTAVERSAGWQGYPNTVIIDQQGVIRGVWLSYSDGVEKEMEALIDSLIVSE